MSFYEKLHHFGACEEALMWVKANNITSLEEAWEKCQKPEWMAWLCNECEGEVLTADQMYRRNVLLYLQYLKRYSPTSISADVDYARLSSVYSFITGNGVAASHYPFWWSWSHCVQEKYRIMWWHHIAELRPSVIRKYLDCPSIPALR